MYHVPREECQTCAMGLVAILAGTSRFFVNRMLVFGIIGNVRGKFARFVKGDSFLLARYQAVSLFVIQSRV